PVDALPQAVLAVERARLALPHAPDVAARAEGAPRAGHDDHVDAVVGLGLGERLRPGVDHRPRERVELVGAVQRDRRDLVLDLVEQVAHDGMSFPTANRCHSPGTPLSAWTPRSSNRRPEPATRSLTVFETRISPAPASAATRAPMRSAMYRPHATGMLPS